MNPTSFHAKPAELQRFYKSQNEANDYPAATQGLNIFNYVMADAHLTARFGSLELYLDMTSLVSDARFSDVKPEEYGGGLLMLTQMIRTGALKKGSNVGLSPELLLTILHGIAIPAYREAQKNLVSEITKMKME